MALSTLQLNTISRGCQTAQKLLDLYSLLKELNVIYDAGGGLKATIQQSDLDAVASFSGLTTAQLADGMYVITTLVRTDVENGLAQLAQLAARA